ncbi:unnamed protein product [Penicillium roqueforti FM164]|uniref:Uncharacterized protein n=1 Tax=Penicillium roqueforti (strain FM164) TaxID=1365484 RepID=W6QVC7_PENRF|nr:unnamed protein product [Penicillium roqueforti FM164]
MRVLNQSSALLGPAGKSKCRRMNLASITFHRRLLGRNPNSICSTKRGTTSEELQHTIEPSDEADIKHLDQSHSRRGDLAPHEALPKSIAATNAEETLIS